MQVLGPRPFRPGVSRKFAVRAAFELQTSDQREEPTVGRAMKAVVVAIVAAGVIAAAASPAAAQAPSWAPADSATVHPGVQTFTDGGQCTANFVFHDGTNIYIGQAAHCSGTAAATDTNGCDAGSLPLGTPVDFVQGGSLISDGTAVGSGTLAYSSWLTMQQRGETNENACAYNDLALVKVNAADVAKV